MYINISPNDALPHDKWDTSRYNLLNMQHISQQFKAVWQKCKHLVDNQWRYPLTLIPLQRRG
jgi:hypothetical protein